MKKKIVFAALAVVAGVVAAADMKLMEAMESGDMKTAVAIAKIPYFEKSVKKSRSATSPMSGFYFGVFASCPFTREIATLKVTHVQRGNHAISVWIPEKMKDFTPVKADIKFIGQFRNRDGKPIFDFHSDDKFAKLWTWCRGNRGGSHEIYYKYSVPRDVPLDEELTLEIRPVGEVDDFVQMYPAAEIAVEK